MPAVLKAATILFAVTAVAKMADPQAAISVEPGESLIDQAVRIRVSGLYPGEHFTLRSSMRDAIGRTWSGEMTATAGPNGTLDLSPSALADSKYPDVDSMRPFWSMRLETPAAAGPFARPVSGSIEVLLQVRTERGTVAATKATRDFTSPSVQVREVREEGLVGRLYEPEVKTERHPAVLVLTGSNGGIPNRHAALLASHGYTAFALAYQGIDPLPVDGIEIPLEYIERGLDWMKRQASVDPTRLGMIGLSKGAELTLLMAGLHPRDFKAVVAVSPSSVVWEGYVRNSRATGEAALKPGRSTWSYRGKPLPFLPKGLTPEIRDRIERDGSVDSIDFYASAYLDKASVDRARIPVETIQAPVLLVASEADGLWPSAEMARDIKAAMHAPNARSESLIYPDSSHLIEDAWLPPVYGTHPPRAAGRWDKATMGGTADGTIHASMESWIRIKALLDANLGLKSAHE